MTLRAWDAIELELVVELVVELEIEFRRTAPAHCVGARDDGFEFNSDP